MIDEKGRRMTRKRRKRKGIRKTEVDPTGRKRIEETVGFLLTLEKEREKKRRP